MKWLLGGVAAVGATMLLLRQGSGTFVIGDQRLAGRRDDPREPSKPDEGAVAAKKVCTEPEERHGYIRIPGTRTDLIYGNCTRRCCDLVYRTFCDENGQNCVNQAHYENCVDENCGSYVGMRMNSQVA